MSESRIEKWLEEWIDAQNDKYVPFGLSETLLKMLADFERDHATPSPVEGNDAVRESLRWAICCVERDALYVKGLREDGTWYCPYCNATSTVKVPYPHFPECPYAIALHLLLQTRPEPAAPSSSDALREKDEK